MFHRGATRLTARGPALSRGPRRSDRRDGAALATEAKCATLEIMCIARAALRDDGQWQRLMSWKPPAGFDMENAARVVFREHSTSVRLNYGALYAAAALAAGLQASAGAGPLARASGRAASSGGRCSRCSSACVAPSRTAAASRSPPQEPVAPTPGASIAGSLAPARSASGEARAREGTRGSRRSQVNAPPLCGRGGDDPPPGAARPRSLRPAPKAEARCCPVARPERASGSRRPGCRSVDSRAGKWAGKRMWPDAGKNHSIETVFTLMSHRLNLCGHLRIPTSSIASNKRKTADGTMGVSTL